MSKGIKDQKYGRLYLTGFKKQLVSEVEKEDVAGAIKMVSERHGVGHKTLCTWIDKYGSKAYKDNRRKRRTLPERDRIVSEIILGKLTIAEVQIKYDVPCRDTVTSWVRKHQRSQKEFHLPNPAVSTFPEIIEPNTEQEISNEAFKQAQLKIRSLEIMLDIASAEFKVNIRKKFGAKQ